MKKIILEEISSDELRTIITDAVKQELSKFDFKPETKEEDFLLTRKEVAKILKISLPTLHDWVNDGKLTAYVIGKNRVRFKRDEIIKYTSTQRTTSNA